MMTIHAHAGVPLPELLTGAATVVDVVLVEVELDVVVLFAVVVVAGATVVVVGATVVVGAAVVVVIGASVVGSTVAIVVTRSADVGTSGLRVGGVAEVVGGTPVEPGVEVVGRDGSEEAMLGRGKLDPPPLEPHAPSSAMNATT